MAPAQSTQSAPTSQAGSRRVSFSSTASAEPSVSFQGPRSSISSAGRRGSIGGGHGGIRLRPLTQLKPEPRTPSNSVSPPPHPGHPRHPTEGAPAPQQHHVIPSPAKGSPVPASSPSGYAPLRRMSISANGQVTIEDRGAPLASVSAPPTALSSPLPSIGLSASMRSGGQSAHSRRGSMAAEQFVSVLAGREEYFHPNPAGLEGGIRAGSVPSFTAGSHSLRTSFGSPHADELPSPAQQFRSGTPSSRPHPYALVEPGEEHAFVEPISGSGLPSSAATGRARARTTVGPGVAGDRARRPSSVAGRLSNSPTPQRAGQVGSRRFTMTAGSSGAGPTAGQAAAMHARRFSTVARDPAISISATSSPQVGLGLGVPLDQTRAGPARQPSDAQAAGPQTWVESLRGDAASLVIGLKAVLGRDGGAESVGELVSLVLNGGIVKARDALYELLQAAQKDVPALQSAYVQVHLHKLLVQLQELVQLASSDEQFSSSFSQAVHLLTGGVSPPLTMSNLQTSAPETSAQGAISKAWQYLGASPAYQSSFLRLVDTLSQFLLASEPGRENLWLTLGETLFAPPSEESGSENATLNPLRELFISLCAAVEQLTGAPIRFFVRALIEWAALADETLTLLAAETHEYLSSPLKPTAPQEYVTHPEGYVYSPVEVRLRTATIANRWAVVMDQEPYKSSTQRLLRALEQTLIGIRGNSTFARFARDARRVWERLTAGDEAGAVSKVEGVLEVARVLAEGLVAVPLPKLETADDNIELTLEDVVISAVDALPDEVSVNHHRKAGRRGLVEGTTLRLEGVQLVAKGVKYTAKARKGVIDVADNGVIDFNLSFDAKITLSPPASYDGKAGSPPPSFSAGFGLPCFDDAKVSVRTCDVTFAGHEGSLRDSVSNLVWPLAKVAIVSRVESASQKWLEATLQGWLPVKPAPTKKVTAGRRAIPQPLQRSVSTQPRRSMGAAHFGAFPSGTESYGTARDRFKASVRQLTGIKMGVLEQLQNPLSEPSSPVLGPDDDSDAEVAPRSSEPSPNKYRRRQSMAQHLTDVAKTDSTLPDHIERPPVAATHGASRRSLPSVFDDEDEFQGPEYDTMARSLSTTARRDTTGYDAIIRPPVAPGGDAIHMLSHRGAMGTFPTGEMTVDQFAAVEAAMGHEAAVSLVGGGEYPSMAGSLSELAARDATTEEAIMSPATVDEGGRLPEVPLSRRAMSMNQVTRHLSGVPDYDEMSANVGTVRGGDQARGSFRQRQTSYDLVPESRLQDKVVMGDQLSDQVMEDHTLPEHQATGFLSRRFSQPDETRAPARPPMGKSLSREASMDATLPENIASPPTSRQSHQHHQHHRLSSVSYGSSPFYDRDGALSARPSFASSGRSPLAMSISLDDDLMRDETTPEAQAAMMRASAASSRRGSAPDEPPPSLSAEDMRKRRQSFKLSDEASRDATLLETIERPPIASQEAQRDDQIAESDLERLHRTRSMSSVRTR